MSLYTKLFAIEKIRAWGRSLWRRAYLPAVGAPLRRARVLIDTTRAITRVPDVVQLMTTILDQINLVVPSTSASIYLIEGDMDRLVADRRINDAGPRIGSVWPRVDFPLTQEMAATHAPIVVPDVRLDPRWRMVEGFDYIRSWLGLPLLAQDELLGFVMLDRDKAIGFLPDEVEMSLAMVSQLGLALRLASLADSRQGQLADMSALYALSRTASSLLKLDELLPALADHMQAVVNATNCLILLLDEQGYIQPAAADQHFHERFRHIHFAPDEPSLGGEVVRQCKPIFIPDTNEPHPSNDRLKALLPFRSVLGIPLLVQGKPIGAVIFGGSHPSFHFDDETIKNAEVAVSHVALAIANGRLFEATRRHAQELAMRDQVRMAIAEAPPERDALVQQVTRSIAEICGYTYVDCWAPTSTHLVLVSAAGAASALTGSILPLDMGICAQVARTCTPCLIEDVQMRSDYVSYSVTLLQQRDALVVPPIVSEVCVPVQCGNQTVLLLNVEHTERLGQRDLLMLSEIATQVGLALENIQLVQEVQRVQADLARSARMATVGTLAAGVAHEFNNVLAAMAGYAQLGLGGMHADQVEALQMVLTMARRGKDITTSMLDFAAADTRRPLPVPLDDIADQGLDLVDMYEAHHAIKVVRERRAPAVVAVDPPQLVQVVVHLLTNARDAMTNGGVLTLRTGIRDQWAELVVGDTGAGIPAAVRERLFEPFVTTKGAFGGGAQGGIGLGLSVCYSIVHGHGGTIDVESEAGTGTTFTVLLPLQDAETSMDVLAVAPSIIPRSLCVLVVDDDSVIHVLLRTMLLRAGYTVLLESEAERARALINQGGIDLLFCDLHLPGIAGDDLARQLRAEGRHLPILLMTRRVDIAGLMRARHAPVNAILTKPLQEDEVLGLLAAVVASPGGDSPRTA